MQFRFERQAKQAIRLTWGHGRYLDPWSISHLLTGLLFGVLGLLLALPFWKILVIVVVLAVLYEAFEMRLGIIEGWQNSLLDVLFAVIGVWLTYRYFATFSFSVLGSVFVGVGVLALLMLYSGWRYHLRHRF